MPDEPLIFVEVALVNGLAGNVQELLDEGAPVIDPNRRRHRDLLFDLQCTKRIGDKLWWVLIKRVVDVLQSPNSMDLKTFSTLTNPGFPCLVR